MEKLIDAIAKAGLDVSVKIEGKEVVKVSVSGKTLNVDILNAEAIGKVLKNLK